MPFTATWKRIQMLGGRTVVPKWSAARGPLGDSFTLLKVAPTHIEVEPPRAKNPQRIPRRDFEAVYQLWTEYCSGSLARGVLTHVTRFSSYIISIFHLIEQRSGGALP